MKILDIEFFRAAGACYNPEMVLESGWTGTIADILRMESIPAKDRIWAASRPGVLSEKTLRLVACRCVRETPLRDGRTVWDLLPEDGPSRKAVEAAEQFARDEISQDELSAAASAAACYAAACYAAAYYSATNASYSACYAAAYYSATYAAAYARQAQIDFFLNAAENETA